MKWTYVIFFLMPVAKNVCAQEFDSIYVHLYTDSLKRGTYNYINIDGKLPNGKFIPLDTTHLAFESSEGHFSGNSLFLPLSAISDSVEIKAILKSKPEVSKRIILHIKKADGGELIPNEADYYRNQRKRKSYRKRSGGFLCILQEFRETDIC